MNYKYKKTKKNMLPKLKPINDKDKKYHYKLSETFKKRKRAINEYINTKSKKTGIEIFGFFNSSICGRLVLKIYNYNKIRDFNLKFIRTAGEKTINNLTFFKF